MLDYAEAVREQLRAVVAGGARRVLVDLSGVDEIDSRGLGALVSLVRLAQERGGAVRFFSARPSVYALFELTRLHRLLDLYPNQALALSQPWRSVGVGNGQAT
jgi:anti-sigma B factor antagonist